MIVSDLVQDPFLRSTLAASAETRQESLDVVAALREKSRDGDETLAPADEKNIAALRKHISAKSSYLRGLTRSAIFLVRQTKGDTAEAKSEIDALHLHLQNLYYEQRHLQGQILDCESYDHKYRQLPLIPETEFLEQKPEFADVDEHALMIARIEHELHEREALEASRQELLKKKQGLIADNKKRKDDLASLDNDLEKFIDAAKPIQKIFEKEY